MSTLNGGFSLTKEETFTEEEKDMIAEFIRTKGVDVCAPSGLTGNEASRATNRTIAEARRAYRANKRAKNK